ncbi:MAG: ABC transporter permease [Bdellovibrio sp.]|nr:ABC transporter permease [Bdellovibrio sp.]
MTLTLHDLATAFKNKTMYLIIFIPLFVFTSLKLIDPQTVSFQKLRIGLIQTEIYNPVILRTIKAESALFSISSLSNAEEGKRWLKEKKIDGLLIRSEKNQDSLCLVVLRKDSRITLSIVEALSTVQQANEGRRLSWISDVKPLQESEIQKKSLPTWVLMLVLLISFIIIPAQVAEEKEKKLLLALLQTPIREIDWLFAKLFFGMISIIAAVIFLHLLGQFEVENIASYAVYLGLGSFCFSSYGILLGFLCRNQASARTLGVIFYLPNILPSALSDFSTKLTAIAPFLTSYQFYKPVSAILLDGEKISNLSYEWLSLLLSGLFTFFCSYHLIKKRWLM